MKPRGRPKNSSTFWAVKSCKCQKNKEQKNSKENHVPALKKSKLSKSENKVTLSGMTEGTASFQSQLCPKQKYQLKESSSAVNEVIEVSDCTVSSSEKSYDEFGLLQSDKSILLTVCKERNAWLNARLINAGLKLLKKRFPNVGGLQDVTRLDTLTFEKELGDFVQILNSNGNHWICISNLGCKPGVVEVFDSMRTGEISIEVKEGIASIMCSSRAVIETIFPYVTQQVGSCDCGLFSLAYAYTICAREEPSTLVYSQTKLHKHFKSSIDYKQIKPFPSCLTQKLPMHLSGTVLGYTAHVDFQMLEMRWCSV